MTILVRWSGDHLKTFINGNKYRFCDTGGGLGTDFDKEFLVDNISPLGGDIYGSAQDCHNLQAVFADCITPDKPVKLLSKLVSGIHYEIGKRAFYGGWWICPTKVTLGWVYFDSNRDAFDKMVSGGMVVHSGGPVEKVMIVGPTPIRSEKEKMMDFFKSTNH